MYRKNTPNQFVGFVAINASTGATMTGTTGFAAFRCLDGGAQASATGTVTDRGNGQYSYALSQADTNGNDCSILFTMTGMIAVEKTFVTTVLDPTSAAFGLLLAKTANITGFNDIAATAVVSAGPITTAGGAVGSVAAPVTVGGYATGQDPATYILGANQADWIDPGTVGQSIGISASYGIMKNQPVDSFPFFMALSSDHYSPAPGKTITASRSLDGGPYAACANIATELGNGMYGINLAAGDVNGSTVGLAFAAAGCDTTLFTIVTNS